MAKFALVSPVALAFGLALSGAASAQVMVGDQQVLEQDMVHVQAHCDALAVAASTAEATGEATVELDETANAMTGVELTTITIQQCIDAGFIDGPVPGLTPSLTQSGGSDDTADVEDDGAEGDDGDTSDGSDDSSDD